jgi:hypothetical protein
MTTQHAGPPADQPDPTRDTTGEATVEGPGAMSEPADLPLAPEGGGGSAAYDTAFGRETPAEPSWVPQRAGAQPVISRPAPSPPLSVSRSVRTLDLSARGGGSAARLLGGRLQAWHVVAVVAGLLAPAGVWAVSNLTDDLTPAARATVGVTRTRAGASRPVVIPTSPGLVPGLPGASPSPQVSRPPVPAATRTAMATPPPVVKVPDLPVTPVPTDARTIRFESYAAGGARIEVSLSDARHQRYDYPVRPAPLAFEIPIGRNVSSSDYYSVRVRLYDPTGSGDRGAVACRVLVDGIVVTSQQGRGYANCYISPYYDIQRR